MITVSLLVRDITELINPADDWLVRGEALGNLRVSRRVWLAAAGENIVFIGHEAEFNAQCRLSEDALVIDGSGFVVMPGFVDPHSHLPFAGTRQDEFREKLVGVSYQEIAARGGGIRGSVRRTREIDAQGLVRQCEKRLDRILLAGTTTLEAKSGYGLDLSTELKQLEVIEALGAIHPVDLVPTFMGAHEVPDEYRGRNDEFLVLMADQVMPEVRRRGLAQFCDIFCEEGYFSYEEAERYLSKAQAAGFKLKVHADEFVSNGAAELAARLGAQSAEHLIAISDKEIEQLSASPTAAVLLPGVSFFLKMDRYAPARKLIESNAIVALGTDFNPGSSMVSSQLFIMQLGIFKLGMTIEEAFNAVTINSAYAVDRHQRVGSLAVGKKMDLLLLDIPDYSYMAYHLGINPVHTVIKSGEVVVRDGQVVYNS
jgi:imidazolonepropionase